jgi:two-component system response regulator HydG
MSGQVISSEVKDALWASEVAMGNPYQSTAADWSSAASFMERHEHDLGELVVELCERRMPDAARRLLLGSGNWWAFTHADRVIHPVEDALKFVHGREIGITKVDLSRVLSAADRFYEKIDTFVGESQAVQQIRIDAWKACFGATLDRTLTLAKTINDQNVLILGEAGTGKEIIASAIQTGHLGSPTGAEPTCPTVNGAAIPAELAESELFGHAKGAFTGAVSSRTGKITEADHGTLFIDEVGDLPPMVQPKLLRVMETNKVCPVGSNRDIDVDVRYVAATSRSLRDMAKVGTFRVDLYDRLAGVVLRVPPLRERPEDIEPIARRLIRRKLELMSAEAFSEVETTIIAWLRSHGSKQPWEGNVRELAAAINNHLLGLDVRYAEPSADNQGPAVPDAILKCTATADEAKRWYIQRVVERFGGNASRAEKVLGIDRGTVRRALRK